MGRKTLQDLLNDAGSRPTAETVDGRAAVLLRADPQRGCGLALTAGSDALLISYSLNYDQVGKAADPCTATLDVATKLAPKLPR